MTDRSEAQPAEDCLVAGVESAPLACCSRLRAVRVSAYDVMTGILVAALVVIAFRTFRDYAISNDEGVQHHYGELIVAYYMSGLRDLSVFHFDNLYLYGGLFDIIAVALSHLLPIDPYDLRHILCALIGIGGIGFAAATARLISGSRAGLFAAIALACCGAWYGTMFNHTKDVPFAVGMVGATFFLIRIARSLPLPRAIDVAGFGVLTGAALGMRVLGLLLLIYAGFAIVLYAPRPWLGHARARCSFVGASLLRLLPAMLLAYLIMVMAWPWAALAPLNPIRGLFAFSQFHYEIKTLLGGRLYTMANVPRLYIPIYILIRMPLIMLLGSALGMLSTLFSEPADANDRTTRRKDILLLSMTVIFPVACQVICDGPAFTGLRHFTFVIPALAILAGIGLDAAMTALATRHRMLASGAFAGVIACFLWNAHTLVMLHPDEYLFYNPLVGGLQGASRRYDMDYWFDSMPEAIGLLEDYLRRTELNDPTKSQRIYSVAVCGERLSFEHSVRLPQLRFDFMPRWDQSQFFIAPTQVNCDRDLKGKVIGVVKRLGVPIAYVKDLRAPSQPAATASRTEQRNHQQRGSTKG